MNDHIKASSILNRDAIVRIKQSHVGFNTTPKTPELFLGTLTSCILKNAERSSGTISTIENV